jgi:hypothetical protein
MAVGARSLFVLPAPAAGLSDGDLGDEVEELSSIGGCGFMGGASDSRGRVGSGGSRGWAALGVGRGRAALGAGCGRGPLGAG